MTWIQQGRAAFTVLPFARHAQLNRADQSRWPGRFKAIEFPVAEALRAAGRQMASVTEFWAMCITANSNNKELAWKFIRDMSSKAVTLGAARNGNGPVRNSFSLSLALGNSPIVLGDVSLANLNGQSGGISIAAINDLGLVLSAVNVSAGGGSAGSIALANRLGDVTLTESLVSATTGGYKVGGSIAVLAGGLVSGYDLTTSASNGALSGDEVRGSGGRLLFQARP